MAHGRRSAVGFVTAGLLAWIVGAAPLAASAQSTALAPPAAAATSEPTPSLELYAVVPLSGPAGSDPQLDQATKQLVDLLSNARVRSAVVPPVDPFEAMGDAATICGQLHAGGLLITTMAHDETRGWLSVSMLPTVGIADATGALDSWHVSAHVRLRLVSCDGKVTWSTVTGADRTHRGTNVPAAIDLVIRAALQSAVHNLAHHVDATTAETLP